MFATKRLSKVNILSISEAYWNVHLADSIFTTYRSSLRYQSLPFLLGLIAFVPPFAWEHTMAHMHIVHL